MVPLPATTNNDKHSVTSGPPIFFLACFSKQIIIIIHSFTRYC
jgi:hypothetical protein